MPIERVTTIPERSVTGPVLKAVQRAQNRALSVWPTIAQKLTALGVSPPNPYPLEDSNATTMYNNPAVLPYIDPHTDTDTRTARVREQWIKDYAITVALLDVQPTTCKLVWAKVHEQCTFPDTAHQIGEWGPAYTTTDTNIYQFPTAKVEYPTKCKSLNNLSISDKIKETITDSTGTPTAYRLRNTALAGGPRCVPLSNHLILHSGLQYQNKSKTMYPWHELTKTFVACMAKKTQTGTYDGTLSVPFVVTADSLAFTRMGLWVGAIVTEMSDNACTTYMADAAHVTTGAGNTLQKADKIKISVKIPAGQKLVVKWGPRPGNNKPHKDDLEAKYKDLQFRYIMYPDWEMSSPDIKVSKKYNWILAVNNLTGFHDLGPDAGNTITFENGAFVTLGICA